MLVARAAVVASVFCFLACSSSDSSGDGAAGQAGSGGTAGSGAGAGGASAGAAGTSGGGGVPATCNGCSTSEGCILATVTRNPIEKDMPWNAFPGKGADGKGTLWVSASEPPPTGGLLTQQMTPNADFTTASAAQTVMLTCVPAGDVQVRAFLDDNGNATGSASSSDYLDTCLAAPRFVAATVVAGAVVEVSLVLNQSCD